MQLLKYTYRLCWRFQKWFLSCNIWIYVYAKTGLDANKKIRSRGIADKFCYFIFMRACYCVDFFYFCGGRLLEGRLVDQVGGVVGCKGANGLSGCASARPTKGSLRFLPFLQLRPVDNERKCGLELVIIRQSRRTHEALYVPRP